MTGFVMMGHILQLRTPPHCAKDGHPLRRENHQIDGSSMQALGLPLGCHGSLCSASEPVFLSLILIVLPTLTPQEPL